ncbi:MAG: tRNA (N6-isopentenyl adenosine(37)-C2)-methylthiotransferase MiaB [Oligoflexia bacterium]|nr:tRNA (N6-isopentenyl adenosine(37)-C2)-methylthiotransferase MiaB [Oligoflexia bacterium]
MTQSQKYYIKTFGCQMNVADSERMAALLDERGLAPAASVEDAQVIIINGCTVREKAVHKAVSALGGYQALKKKGEGAPVIGIGGCVGQLDQGKLFKRAPYLDFVFGTDTIDNLPEILHRVQSGERHVVYADFDKSMDYSTETKVQAHKAQAFVNIMKGCDKYCTYCIVPFTRGREKSRTIDEVVNDVARLVAMGVREVTLLGQNVNSFGKGNPNAKAREPRELHNRIGKVGPKEGEENFPQLLRALDTDPRCAALRRIRFTSSHPLDFSDELIECYAPAEKGGVSRLAAHLHLPVQSGSDAVLSKMGRHHRIEGYYAQMERLRELNPEVGLSTDLIVGFPTETEADFEATLALLDRVRFDNIFAFAYSPRPGTRAAKLPDDVPDPLKNERLNRLLKHQLRIAEGRYATRVGKVMEILVEGEAKNQNLAGGASGASEAGGETGAESAREAGEEPGRGQGHGHEHEHGHGHGHHAEPEESSAAKSLLLAFGLRKGPRVWTGRTSCNRVVNFVSEAPRNFTGKFVQVRITGSTALSLNGELLLDGTEGAT